MTFSGREYTIEAGVHRATVTEVGAGLQRFTAGGVDVTCTYDVHGLPPKGCGATLLPWPNRIRDGRYTFEGTAQQLALTEPKAGNAIHGLARWARWTEVSHTADRVTLRHDIVPQTGYPFEVRVEATFAVSAEHGLTVTLGARNLGRTRAPFGAGSHPYLSTRGHALADTTVRVPARERLITDDKQVPVGARSVDNTEHDLRRGKRLRTTRFDDGFTGLSLDGGRGAAEVETPSGGARLWFDETYKFLQVFTVENLTPGQSGVAIEPMTCAPDAFNSGAGLIVLELDGAWTGSWGIVPI
ncbi:MAG: aldose 1-epimerase family protein [Jatrophihabitans sp.]|uniref:aldose 1-epimerase family protein n=1 Tax=Jatrophihabitans sp. TaxID=1932789 RepID=UPI003913529D